MLTHEEKVMALIGGLSIGIIFLALAALFITPNLNVAEPMPVPTMTVVLEEPEWVKE